MAGLTPMGGSLVFYSIKCTGKNLGEERRSSNESYVWGKENPEGPSKGVKKRKKSADPGTSQKKKGKSGGQRARGRRESKSKHFSGPARQKNKIDLLAVGGLSWKQDQDSKEKRRKR